jgi:hypothetical protein
MLRKANLANSALSLIVVSINFLLFLMLVDSQPHTPLYATAVVLIPLSLVLLFMSALFGCMLLDEEPTSR